jgi:pantetheine-phosphate adenylyltransferase
MKALYAGSFDPPHLGHLDIIRRAAATVDQLVVGVAGNPEKTPFLSTPVRVGILAAECAGLANVQVTAFAGATVTWAKANGITCLIRGLRGPADLEPEMAMATVNRGFGCETLFLACDPALGHISSRMLRQVMGAGLPTGGLLPARAVEALLTVDGRRQT